MPLPCCSGVKAKSLERQWSFRTTNEKRVRRLDGLLNGPLDYFFKKVPLACVVRLGVDVCNGFVNIELLILRS